MSMMECPACHSLMDSDASECPVCNLLNPRITGSVENKAEILRQLAEQHTLRILGNLEIGVQALAYKADGDHYVSDGTRYVSLFKGNDLTFGKVCWSEHAFGQSKADAHAKMNLVIKRGGTATEKTISYPTPDLDDLWYTGAVLEPGFKLKLYVGNADHCTETEKVTLL